MANRKLTKREEYIKSLELKSRAIANFHQGPKFKPQSVSYKALKSMGKEEQKKREKYLKAYQKKYEKQKKEKQRKEVEKRQKAQERKLKSLEKKAQERYRKLAFTREKKIKQFASMYAGNYKVNIGTALTTERQLAKMTTAEKSLRIQALMAWLKNTPTITELRKMMKDIEELSSETGVDTDTLVDDMEELGYSGVEILDSSYLDSEKDIRPAIEELNREHGTGNWSHSEMMSMARANSINRLLMENESTRNAYVDLAEQANSTDIMRASTGRKRK